jgi:hypothetical protein
MLMKTRLKLLVVIVPLGVICVVGVAASLVASAFGWLDQKCQEWFEHIYYGSGKRRG